MNKLINFIESEWSRPAIVCFTIFLFCFFAFLFSLADKREANRIEAQRQAWIKQGYDIRDNFQPQVIGCDYDEQLIITPY